MLTKTDLQQIDNIVKKRVREEIEQEVQNAKEELQADIKMSQIRIMEEINNVKDRLKNLEMKLPDLTIGVSSPHCFVGSEIPPKQKILRIHSWA